MNKERTFCAGLLLPSQQLRLVGVGGETINEYPRPRCRVDNAARHQEILLGWPLNRYPQFIGRSEAFINRYGVTSVFLARFTAVVRAFVPLVAGILGMPPRQFYAANVLSALAWAPAHVFPGVLLAMAISLAGASAGQLTLLIIAGLVAVSAAVGATRFYLNRHPLPARLRLPDIAA